MYNVQCIASLISPVHQRILYDHYFVHSPVMPMSSASFRPCPTVAALKKCKPLIWGVKIADTFLAF